MWRKSSYSDASGSCVEVAWHKSTYSNNNGGCVEVRWRKSTHSGGDGGGCVETAQHCDLIHVRVSKDPNGPQLAFNDGDWALFLVAVGTFG